MYKLAVIGNPIAHSLSPLIWSEFARQCEIELEYNKICAPIDDFEHVVRDFFASGGHALSVTAPFKSRELFISRGGRELRYISCLNASNELTKILNRLQEG